MSIKARSKVRLPSKQYREGYERIDWGAKSEEMVQLGVVVNAAGDVYLKKPRTRLGGFYAAFNAIPPREEK